MKQIFSLILACVVSGYVSKGFAEVLEVTPVNMGTVAVANNSSVQTLTMDKFGNVINSGGFRVLSEGEPGLYRLINLIPNVTYNVTVTVQNTTMNPGQASLEFFDFDITSYDTQVLTDSNGEADVRVGGRITTSGSGNLVFADAVHASTIRVTVGF